MKKNSTLKSLSKKAIQLLFLLFYFSSSLHAAASKKVYSIGNPSSVSNSSQWSYTSGGASCGCTPNFSKDTVYIQTNTTSTANVHVGSGAQLYVTNNATFSVSQDVTFKNGAVVNVASGSSMAVTGSIENKNNSNQIVVNGTLSATQTFKGGTGATITGSGILTAATVNPNGGTVFGSTAACAGGCSVTAPLPVTLVRFEAKKVDESVLLSWTTGSEINNDFFAVEKSTDAKNFEVIDQILGAGNSNHSIDYSSTDHHASASRSYYRLKQVDFDGSIAYSKTVEINGSTLENAFFSVALSPNPASNNLLLSFANCPKNSLVNVSISELSGKEVFHSTYALGTQISTSNIDTSNLSAGLYVLSTSCDGNSSHQKLVIEKRD